MTRESLSSEEKKHIVEEIDYDINRGVYEQFPKLKERLSYIRRKLYATIYLINGEEISDGEMKTLIENDYIHE